MASVQVGPVGDIVRANIRRIREVRDHSLRDLAKHLADIGHPIAASGIQRIEVGTRRVDVDDLVALAKTLDVPPIDLLEPWDCDVCHGTPPAGFSCETCGARGGTPDRPGFAWGGGR